MKKTINHIALFFVGMAFVACNSSTSETSNTSDIESELTSSNDTTIIVAALAGGSVSFVADAETMRKDWQKFLAQQQNGASVKVENVEIVFNEETKKYYLNASGTLDSLALKAAIELRMGSVNCLMLSGQTLMCTATGTCASDPTGCLPAEMYCTKCADEEGACTKTVTSTPTAMFPSVETGSCSE